MVGWSASDEFESIFEKKSILGNYFKMPGETEGIKYSQKCYVANTVKRV